jgi:hypothetical protein
MTYKILSPRLGTPSDEFVPSDGVNIEALIAGGFIEDITNKKPAKVKNDEPKD